MELNLRVDDAPANTILTVSTEDNCELLVFLLPVSVQPRDGLELLEAGVATVFAPQNISTTSLQT